MIFIKSNNHFSDEEYDLLYQDLSPLEKADEYLLRDKPGNPITSLGNFKLRASLSRDLEDLSEEFNISTGLTKHFLRLYKVELMDKDTVRKEMERELEPGYLLGKNGKPFKREYIKPLRNSGYDVYYYTDENGKRKSKMHHRKIVEDFIGRELKKDESIHHVDGNRTNNSINNLYICDSYEEHAEIHRDLDRITYELFNLGIIKFSHGNYCLDEMFFDDIDRYNAKKRIFNENLEYYKGGT